MRPAPRSSSRLVPAASRVDLPEPGTPVTRVSPAQRSQAAAISSSTPSSAKVGGLPGSTRSVMSMAKPLSPCTGGEVAAEAAAEPARQHDRVRAVDGAARAQDALAGGVEEPLAKAAHDHAVETRGGSPRELPVDLDEGRLPGLQGDVGGAALGGPQQEFV